ncbi:T9SS type A sorting domain-containing protein [Pontimicrobium sp. SW4]|uniref:T9SS type A sorting domain-containing protein n=1 Tax=Pontimicrobium sp. SW4 TaxID=3153519 RepID=A0AAU7BNY4_9FLAO
MKTFTFLTFILLSLTMYTQNTYVPDDNFEQALIDLGYDTVLDDYVLTSNINAVTFLNVNNSNISDLTGIEDFTALTELRCFGNQLTVLDVSQNLSLEILNCGSNSLTTLDVRDNALLEELRCGNNSITQLNLSLNTSLMLINCNNNALKALMVNNGNNTNIIEFNASSNPNLICIQVDDITYSYTNWGNYDAQTSFSEDCHFNDIYVPDDNFEQVLIDLGYDTVLDNYVDKNSIKTVTSLDLLAKDIADLTGIEGFTGLTLLTASNNLLTSVDLSKNIQLETLYIMFNQLNTLDLSSNINLKTLFCGYNNLTSIEITQNTALEKISIGQNQLTSIDITNKPNLKDLFCGHNQITSLDVTQNLALEVLACNSNLLTELNVKNNTLLKRLICGDNAIEQLNLNLNTNLTEINCPSNNLEALDISNGNNTNVTFFDASNNHNLTCIQVDDITYSYTNWGNYDAQTSFSENCHFTEAYVPDNNFEQALIDLGYDTTLDGYVKINSIDTITFLNVNSKNIIDLTGIEAFLNLKTLYAVGNSITSVNFSNNVLLEDLYFNNNQLSTINLSSNTNLKQFQCAYNNLNSLSLNYNLLLESLILNNNNISSIDVTQNTALINFIISNNQISNIDISNNSNLIYFYCDNNQISSLDVSQLLNLNYLTCSNNNLSNLNVSQNSALKTLYCYDNQLTNLDVTNNTLLEFLFCRINDISSLDVSQNTALTILKCDDNNLTSLDVSQNPYLTTLTCHINNLETLNVKNGNNSNFVEFNATSNTGLTCITVDNVAYSTANWINIDAQTTFSESCSTLSIDDFNLAASITLHPNPTREFININATSNFQVNLVEIFNALGKKVLISNDTSINVKELNSGLYFVKVSLGEKEVIKKLIIK